MACQVDLSNNVSIHDKRALLSKGINVRQAGQKTESREIKRKKKPTICLPAGKGKRHLTKHPGEKAACTSLDQFH